jgi:catechol 2,3-dioxygenase-like lactoylglutathione lyase family enzyme
MRIEHLGYQVHDPEEVALWYTQHLGFRVVRTLGGAANPHFLVDGSGQVMLEIYANPQVHVPDYASMSPLLLHLAFSVEDVEGTRKRLLAAGATAVGEVSVTTAGDHLAMMRDPWGFAIQLAKRQHPML